MEELPPGETLDGDSFEGPPPLLELPPVLGGESPGLAEMEVTPDLGLPSAAIVRGHERSKHMQADNKHRTG